MTEQKQNQRGIDATQVLDNAAFNEAFALLNEAVLSQLDACPIRDHEGRLLLTQLRKIAFMYEGMLRGMVETGKLAKHKIDMNNLRDEGAGRKLLRIVRS